MICVFHPFFLTTQQQIVNTLFSILPINPEWKYTGKRSNWNFYCFRSGAKRIEKSQTKRLEIASNTFRTDQLISAIYLSCHVQSKNSINKDCVLCGVCCVLSVCVCEAINIVTRTSNGNLKHYEINYCTHNNKATL